MSYDQISRIIVAAADIIDTGGLCKRMLWNGRGAHCTNGALMVAINGSERTHMTDGECRLFWAAGRRIATYLGLEDNDGLSPLPVWNNHPDRTKDEVVAAMRASAGLVTTEAMRA